MIITVSLMSSELATRSGITIGGEGGDCEFSLQLRNTLFRTPRCVYQNVLLWKGDVLQTGNNGFSLYWRHWVASNDLQLGIGQCFLRADPPELPARWIFLLRFAHYTLIALSHDQHSQTVILRARTSQHFQGTRRNGPPPLCYLPFMLRVTIHEKICDLPV